MPTTPVFREGFESKLAVYTGSRAAASEITTAIFSVAVGAGFKQMTTGALSLGPVLAGAITQHAAIASFPLGAGLGGIWYGAFPGSVGAATTVTVTGGLVLAFSLLSAFAGVLADPAQRRLGLHQRRLKRLIDAIGQDLESDLKGEGPGRFRVCESLCRAHSRPRRSVARNVARAWLIGAGVDAASSAAHAGPSPCPWSLRQDDEDSFANRRLVPATPGQEVEEMAGIGDVLDLDRYPLDRPASARGRAPGGGMPRRARP